MYISKNRRFKTEIKPDISCKKPKYLMITNWFDPKNLSIIQLKYFNEKLFISYTLYFVHFWSDLLFTLISIYITILNMKISSASTTCDKSDIVAVIFYHRIGHDNDGTEYSLLSPLQNIGNQFLNSISIFLSTYLCRSFGTFIRKQYMYGFLIS